jgi:glycosyltransferase involved in cell wall biosynthesis
MIERLWLGDDAIRPLLVCSDRRSPAPAAAPGQAWVRCDTPWVLRRMRRFRRLQALSFRAAVQSRGRRIARAAQAERCHAIIACTGGDLIDLPAAVTAGRQASLPVFLHYFDDYRFQWRIPNPAWHEKTAAAISEAVEADVLGQAAGVVVPNEILAEDIRARADLPVAVIRNAIDTEIAARLRREAVDSRPLAHGERTVLYTGSVYEAQGDALRRCALAIEMLRQRGHPLRLHVYTADSAERIHAQRLPTSVVVHPAVSNSDSFILQTRADILFLPLGFQTRYPELIRSSSPGKFGEYLASARPMLVHAPADSFPASYAAKLGCGAVCDQPDQHALAATILRLLEDEAWTQGLVTRALAASDDFSLTANRLACRTFIESQFR